MENGKVTVAEVFPMCDKMKKIMTILNLSSVIHLLQDIWYGPGLVIVARPRLLSSTKVSKSMLTIISTKF